MVTSGESEGEVDYGYWELLKLLEEKLLKDILEQLLEEILEKLLEEILD